ncbi:MAG TPA: hypothetical protein VFG45_02165 [Candidatus Nitrosocosmicus sp.]|nr:hypothetical protein [Candidatus Nitrosocosmicus sp.]
MTIKIPPRINPTIGITTIIARPLKSEPSHPRTARIAMSVTPNGLSFCIDTIDNYNHLNTIEKETQNLLL